MEIWNDMKRQQRSRPLIAAVVVLALTVAACPASIGIGMPATGSLTPHIPADRLLELTTGKPSPTSFVKYGGDFSSYWATAQKSFAGKAYEAIYAHSENARLAAMRSPLRFEVTAVQGSPHAAHDLALINIRTGQVVDKLQLKMGSGNALKALSNSKYSGMKIVTDADSLKYLKGQLARAEAGATRRGIGLKPEMQTLKNALKSGKLATKTHTGAPLPTSQHISAIAKKQTQVGFNKAGTLAKTGRSASKIVPAGTGGSVSASKPCLAVRVLKSPGVTAGGLTFIIDSSIAYYQFHDGQFNKSALQERIQDAAAKAVAVGLAVQAVYVVCATPHGLVVMGVAVMTYVAADAAISYFRSEYGKKHIAVQDLAGIAPASFLANLPSTMADDLAKARKGVTGGDTVAVSDLRGILPEQSRSGQKPAHTRENSLGLGRRGSRATIGSSLLGAGHAHP